MDKGKGAQIQQGILEKERRKDFAVMHTMRFKYRKRYFTDSGIIGTKSYVFDNYQQLKS